MIKSIVTFILLTLTAFSFGQTENYWTKKSNFPGLKRERAIAFTVNNYAYIGTGVDTAEIVHNDLWKYDPILDTWTQVASLPASVRRNAVAFSINDFGYVGTGIDSVSAQAPNAEIYNDFWQYSPATNSWEQKANFPGSNNNGVYFATAFTVDSKGYICCGKVGPNNYSKELWEYKPTTDQWARLQDFPGGVRYQLSSFSIGYKGYVGLGTDQDMYRNDFWEFNATTNMWTQIADLPSSERSAAMTFTIEQRGFVCMGGNGGLLDDLWEYNPYENAWTARDDYGGSERKNGVGFSLNGKGYVGLGKGYSGKKQSLHEYTPASVLGIEDLENNFSVYPNPAVSHVNIKTKSKEISHFELLTHTGELLLSVKKSLRIDLSRFPTGTYIVNAYNSSNKQLSQQRIIKL